MEEVRGLNAPSSSTFSLPIHEQLDEALTHYLIMGMSPEDYWHGEPSLVRNYRKKYDIEGENDDFGQWKQGSYFYDALNSSSPMFNAMTKRSKPYPYNKKPYYQQSAEDKVNKEQESIVKKFQMLADAFNEDFKKRKEKGDDSSKQQ